MVLHWNIPFPKQCFDIHGGKNCNRKHLLRRRYCSHCCNIALHYWNSCSISMNILSSLCHHTELSYAILAFNRKLSKKVIITLNSSICRDLLYINCFYMLEELELYKSILFIMKPFMTNISWVWISHRCTLSFSLFV